MSEQPLAGVGATALWVAYLRARETVRPHRLFSDPYAARFLDAAPGWPPEIEEDDGPVSAAGAAFAWQAAVRTRFLDDSLLAAGNDGCRQAVLLAAGLDARAYRLDWPAGTRLFEVDTPDVLRFKESVLDGQGAVPRCDRTVVEADLREDWQELLVSAGFDATRRTAWLVEGLLVYLSAGEVARLLSAVAALSTAGSRLCLEHGGIALTAIDNRVWSVPVVRAIASLWRGGMGEATPGWLAGNGWAVQTHALDAVGESYQRPAPVATVGGFVTASRH